MGDLYDMEEDFDFGAGGSGGGAGGPPSAPAQLPSSKAATATATATAAAGSKRLHADDSDDEEFYGTKKIAVPEDFAMKADHATTTILSLRSSLSGKEATIVQLQAAVAAANEACEQWREAFRGLLPPQQPSVEPEPAAVVAELTRLSTSQKKLAEQVREKTKRETALLLQIISKDQEIAELQTALQDAKNALLPEPTQTRRLLLDPAVHREFTYMKAELEAAQKRVRSLGEELEAVQFTPHSKSGRMLMAKCRTLQEENEEIGREASQGKMHHLEVEIALQKDLIAELRSGYTDLDEYFGAMDDDLEQLQRQVFNLQQQLKQKDNQIRKLQQQTQKPLTQQ